jgi:hypothetical protein
MNAKIVKDRRSDIDRKFDEMYNAMVRKAKLTPYQSQIVARYLREVMGMRLHEIEAAKDMSWMISLIEGERFGTAPKRGATRLVRAQKRSAEAINEAYSHNCIDANGFWNSYDGCGLEYLKARLKTHNVDFEIVI